jgi:hypothetical protein
VTFCDDKSCPLQTFGRCLQLSVQRELPSQIEPREFESVTAKECETEKQIARAALIVDFSKAQNLQLRSTLSDQTVDLIDSEFTYMQHNAVILYERELAKLQPGRNPCKPEMCGSSPCIRFDDEPEYNCAIRTSPPQKSNLAK